MSALLESEVENATIAWLMALGYEILRGPDIAAGEAAAERNDPGYRDVVLERRLRKALVTLNPSLPPDALEEAYRKLTRSDAPSLIERNRAIHRMMVDGVTVEYRRKDGSIAGDQARVIDFDDPSANNWVALNQFTVVEGQYNRRPDVVLFLNGLPVAVIELKNPADESATIWSAFQQLQTYQAQIPALFATNAALIASDGVQARIGAIGAGKEWFKPWRTITGRDDAAGMAELHVMLEGVFEKQRFLDLIRHFIVFEDEGGGKLTKKLAGYHQFHAVNVAIAETLRATGAGASGGARDVGRFFAHAQSGGKEGDRRVGVVWHTQGSGKSLTMAFYAGRAILHPAMENPTIVVLTDRNDLDDQLFGTFCALPRPLAPAARAGCGSRRSSREVARWRLAAWCSLPFRSSFPRKRATVIRFCRTGGTSWSSPTRRTAANMISSMASPAHMRDALPNASFIGFTGTPIEKADANTRAVFGDYISVYDIQRAVADGATVPIYYESRLAKLELKGIRTS